MLNMMQIVDKLNVAPEQFNQLMQEEKYCQAKWLFYVCLVTAVFVEVDEAVMERLFGENGEFSTELVKKAYEKAGGGIDRSTEDYAEDARYGVDVRFLLQKERILDGTTTAQTGNEHSKVC